jgi:putative ABC transport system substrate-binding protein
LIALKPDLIFASTTPMTAILKRATSTIPVVFAQVSDPVGSGFVESLARPGGNITGFINMEDAMGGKWLEILKEAAPIVNHAIIIFNPDTAPGAGRYFLPSFEMAAQRLGISGIATPVHDPSEIERAIGDLAARPNGGLVAMGDSFLIVHFELVRKLAESYKLPAIYGLGARAREGALISYAPDTSDLYRKSAAYVDRILRGDNPRDLPVQLPTKFNLAINLKAAKTIGLTIPQTLLATADEVIE